MKTKEEIIEYIYDMNLQNLTEKTSFDRAYKQGIEDTIEDLIELNLLTIPVVVGSYSEKQVDNAYDKGFKDAMVKYRK